MYAIIEIGGKQYKVEKGDEIKTQKVHVKEGKSYKAEGVLLLKEGRKISVGEPYLKGKTVTCEVLKHLKGKKTIAYKYKKRKKTRWKKGHRQNLSLLKITEIK